MRRVALALFALCLFVFPVDAQRVVSRTQDSAVFAFDQDTTWRALIEGLMKANIQPQTMDKASGSVIFRLEGQWTNYWGGVNSAVSTMTTKVVKSNSTWQALVVSGNVFCKPKPGGTEVTVTLRFAGFNGFASWLAGAHWQELITSGWLERRILDLTEERLPKEVVIPEKPGDPAALQAAEDAISSLRKLDAAYKIGADATALTQYLVDAQAKFDAFADGPHARVMPKSRESLAEALEDYKGARAAAAPEDRQAQLVKARGAIARSMENLEAFRKWSAEITPVKQAQMIRPIDVARETEKPKVDEELERTLDPATIFEVDVDKPKDAKFVYVEVVASARAALKFTVDGAVIHSGPVEAEQLVRGTADQSVVIRAHYLSELRVSAAGKAIELPQGKKQLVIRVRN